LKNQSECSLAPAVAAAACASEAFLFLAGDHPMAGRRAAGVSLWNPGHEWLRADTTEPALSFLPTGLWMIGLGNLGQAVLWMLTTLPYGGREEVELVLQDFDRIAPSNDSTSVLTQPAAIGKMKTRVIAEWLERRKFRTAIEERRFGEWTQRHKFEPGIAICGVDNADARRSLEGAGFGLIIEGPRGWTSGIQEFSVHTFPSSFKATELWATDGASAGDDPAAMQGGF
jgi:hypothetical protein